MPSDASAENYTDLIDECHEMRAMLRRIMSLPDTCEGPGELRLKTNLMWSCLQPARLDAGDIGR
ncbi:hypothetical protein AB0J83_32430 [Actinoplanes sp. NPDC049596]|uniref:hypothetical protein n=1 Tax=unclassified Actinoplanes TaxID=2626549 RepID=UPI00341C46DF